MFDLHDFAMVLSKAVILLDQVYLNFHITKTFGQKNVRTWDTTLLESFFVLFLAIFNALSVENTRIYI